VLVHGWGGDKSDEHVIETAPYYAKEDYGVLLLDLRGHGESGGERRILGYKETHDVCGALAWLEEQGYGPGEGVLHGWSTGGAATVRAAPGTGVAAVVEEAGYADLPLVLRECSPKAAACRASHLSRAFGEQDLRRRFVALLALYPLHPGRHVRIPF
jgi:uncharacterized protein